MTALCILFHFILFWPWAHFIISPTTQLPACLIFPLLCPLPLPPQVVCILYTLSVSRTTFASEMDGFGFSNLMNVAVLQVPRAHVGHVGQKACVYGDGGGWLRECCVYGDGGGWLRECCHGRA